MKNYDLMILGPATRDVNIDYTGEEVRAIGGAVTFGAPAAYAANPRVLAAVKAAAEDGDIADFIASFGIPREDVVLLPSKATTLMPHQMRMWFIYPSRYRWGIWLRWKSNRSHSARKKAAAILSTSRNPSRNFFFITSNVLMEENVRRISKSPQLGPKNGRRSIL